MHGSPPQPLPPAPPRRSAARQATLNLVLVFLLGLFLARLPSTLGQLSGRFGFTDPIEDVYSLIQSQHVDPKPVEELQAGAIRGMLETLDDDYAAYIPAKEVPEFEKEMTGAYSGIGCRIEVRDGWLTITSPMEDSPAWEAGIVAGDRVVKIGEESTFNKTADEAVTKLTGPEGTQVSFTIERDGKELPFTLTRRPLVDKAARGFSRLGDGSGHWDYLIDPQSRVAYVRLSQFTPTATPELLEALQQAGRTAGRNGGQGLGGLILDLRNNPGGVLGAALEISDLFLTDGPIVSTRDRNGRGETFEAKEPMTLSDLPIAVLVNENSASASEIVAGALSDHDRAVVIGTRSFGKGLVQTVAEIPRAGGAQVKFTTQRYYLPSGRLIQRTDDSTEWGVDPSPGFYVPMDEKQQIAAFLKRRDWDILRRHDPEAVHDDAPAQRWSDPVWIEQEAKDPQLAAAVRAMSARVTTGAWQPISDAKDVHGKLAVKELRDLQKSRERLGMEFASIQKRIAALEKVAASGGTAPSDEPADLWPDDLDLTGGTIKVFDKDGKEVTDLKVTGADIERWLAHADVQPSKPVEGAAPGPAPAGATDDKPEPRP